MTEDDIRAIVLEEIAAIAPEADLESLDPTADIREELDMDSMDIMNLTIALHERLRIDIPEEDAVQLVTLAGAVAYIARKTA